MTKAELLVAIAALPDDTPVVDASGQSLTLTIPVWEPSGRPVVCLSAPCQTCANTLALLLELQQIRTRIEALESLGPLPVHQTERCGGQMPLSVWTTDYQPEASPSVVFGGTQSSETHETLVERIFKPYLDGSLVIKTGSST